MYLSLIYGKSLVYKVLGDIKKMPSKYSYNIRKTIIILYIANTLFITDTLSIIL